MNAQQRTFARLVAVDGMALGPAYTKAGYENKYPDQAAARLAKNDKVAAEIDRMSETSLTVALDNRDRKREELADACFMTPEWFESEFGVKIESVNDVKHFFDIKLKAMQEDSRLAGHYPKEGGASGGVPNTPYIAGNTFTVNHHSPQEESEATGRVVDA